MKKLIPKHLAIYMLSLLFITACKKENDSQPKPEQAALAISITHQVDEKELIFDSILYQNEAGNKYSVTKLNYYLSNFTLIKNSGERVLLEPIFYMDGRAGKQSLYLTEIPVGNYDSICFDIGLNPIQNISNSLENTASNINMQWPEIIGGGYHFLKFEGFYLDSTNIRQGFTMHLGTNAMLVQHKALAAKLSFAANGSQNMQILMNLNQWFKQPYTYDLNKDGNYTMAIPELMTIIKNNGNDVFTQK